jgi:hypothetical protein
MLANSENIQELVREQWPDGGWSAFHSRSTKRKQKIPSTEVGVERALALGLRASDPVLERAAQYILKIMEGELIFPDYHEKIDRWLASLELLARTFPTWIYRAEEAVGWLWAQQNEQGYWDFGLRPYSTANLPLSDNWRNRKNRIFDWTTRVLILLKKYADGVQTN